MVPLVGLCLESTMKRIIRHTASAILLSLALLSCQGRAGDRTPETGGEASASATVIEVAVSAPASLSSAPRVVDDGQDTAVAGTEAEDRVTDAMLLSPRLGLMRMSSIAPGATSSDRRSMTYVARMELEGVNSETSLPFTILVNLHPLIRLAPADFVATKTLSLDEIDRVIGTAERGFLMTAKLPSGDMTIHPNVSDPDREQKNLFAMDLERVVSKAQFSLKPGLEKTFSLTSHLTTELKTIGSGSLDGWAIGGSSKSVYLFRDQAGDRHYLQDQKYAEGFTTAPGELMKMSDYAGTDGKWDSSKPGATNFAKRSFLGPHASDNILDNGQDDAGKVGKSLENGIYFYEHALKETPQDKTPYPETVTYAHIAYAKVYATFTPTGGRQMISEETYTDGYGNTNKFQGRFKVYATKEDATKELASGSEYGVGFNATVPKEDKEYFGRYWINDVKADGSYDIHIKRVYVSFLSPRMLQDIPAGKDPYQSDRWYWIMVPSSFYDAHKDDSSYTFRDGQAPADYVVKSDKSVEVTYQTRHFLLMHDEPGDFYVGDSDHQFYDTLLAARAAGNERPMKYSKGRMVYLTPLNAQGGEGKVFNCDTRRNNIYDLAIKKVKGLGYNYDPVDPADPNVPKPTPGENPYEKDRPLPPINAPEEQRIRVKAVVADWNLMRHTYDLKSLAE